MMTKNLGKGIINEIHDFNTGLKYDLDVTTANCTVSKLKLDDGPDSVVNGSMLRVRNPTEFFSFNEDYKYIGVVRIRVFHQLILIWFIRYVCVLLIQQNTSIHIFTGPQEKQ